MHRQDRTHRGSPALFLICGCALFVACAALLGPGPTKLPDGANPEDFDPAPREEIEPIEACAPACEKLLRHGCPQGQPTAHGHACERRCRDHERSGLVSWNPRCVARIRDVVPTFCDVATACEKVPAP